MFEPDKITRNGGPSNGSAQKDTPLREASKPLMLQGKMWVIASLAARLLAASLQSRDQAVCRWSDPTSNLAQVGTVAPKLGSHCIEPDPRDPVGQLSTRPLLSYQDLAHFGSELANMVPRVIEL